MANMVRTNDAVVRSRECAPRRPSARYPIAKPPIGTRSHRSLACA